MNTRDRQEPSGPPEPLGMSRTLGWFSIGLGVTQLLAPRSFSRLVGVKDHPLLFRALGARELAVGLGILSQPKASDWLWGRVAGDVMDMGLLGAAFVSPRAEHGRVALAAAAVVGITAADLMCSREVGRSRTLPHRESMPIEGGIPVRRVVSVLCSPDQAYRFWRNFENFPRFMKHLEAVTSLADNRSHWVARGPGGRKVEWDAETLDDRPNELIAWRSLADAQVENAGVVRFEPATGGRGTVVSVELAYRPPAGAVGSMLAWLAGQSPEQQVRHDLQRFKQILETGEVPTTLGQSTGRRGPVSRALLNPQTERS